MTLKERLNQKGTRLSGLSGKEKGRNATKKKKATSTISRTNENSQAVDGQKGWAVRQQLTSKGGKKATVSKSSETEEDKGGDILVSFIEEAGKGGKTLAPVAAFRETQKGLKGGKSSATAGKIHWCRF